MKEVDIRQCWRSIEVPTASAQICPVPTIMMLEHNKLAQIGLLSM